MKKSIFMSVAMSLFALSVSATNISEKETIQTVNKNELKKEIMNDSLEITQKTYVSSIIKKYGDIADVMELFGVKRVGGFGIRKVLTHVITVRTAAFVHRVPKDDFLLMVQNAVKGKANITE